MPAKIDVDAVVHTNSIEADAQVGNPVNLPEVISVNGQSGNVTITLENLGYQNPDWAQDDSEQQDYIKNRPAMRAGTGENSIIEGNIEKNEAVGKYAHAEGSYTKAISSSSHAEGNYTQATASASHAEGSNTVAGGSEAHAEGYNTAASGGTSHSEGMGTKATGDYSHAEGLTTESAGVASHAEGNQSESKGAYSHAEGMSTAESNYSHSEGQSTIASGVAAHAEGTGTTASAANAHAEGGSTSASGPQSHAEGSHTTASGDYSHAEGSGTEASGTTSHAEGGASKAMGGTSHAEGGSTVASGICAHSEGGSTTASGVTAHAEGGGTVASGDASHAEGGGTIAASDHQHAQGKYNIADDKDVYADIVGNGTDDNHRSNAYTLDWSGNGWYAGKVSAGPAEQPADPVNANDLVTKHYLDQDISSRVRAVDAEMAESRFDDSLPEGVSTPPISSEIFEVTGIPTYVSDPAEYSSYGLTEPGWYAFVEIAPKDGVTVSARTLVVEGAAGYIAAASKYIYVAVKFGVAAMTQAVTINWGSYTETIIFKATDLAVRNLDQRVTFYVYDADPFATWEYKRSEDAVFVGTKYYTEENGTYTQAAVKAHELIPADTYYTHSYAATTDETFQDGVTYYEVVSGSYKPAEVIVGETVPASTYYVDQWTLTTDTRFVGTRYYAESDGEYEQIAVKAGEPVPAYYNANDVYALTTDATFVEGKTYYTKTGDTYTEAAVTAGEAVTADTYYTKTVEYVLTEDTVFQEGKTYYTKSGTTYTAAEVTVGEQLPTVYYVHSKVIISGLVRNVTYRLNQLVDCPMEFILPEIDDETHGAWFEIRCRHAGAYSMTLTPPEGVKIATEHTQKETAGINMINLHYTVVDGVKIWRFMNTHSSIPA